MHYEEQFCEIILNLDQWFRRCRLKIVLELWQPICLVGQNHLCNFGIRHHEEEFCEISLNLEQWLRRRCRLKIFHIQSSGDLFFSGAEPFAQVW